MPTRQRLEPNASNDMILGELRGQVRELVHGVNGLSQKFDGLTREVIALGPLAADIAKLKNDVEELKNSGNQQSGALKVIIALAHSPVIMWAVVVAGIAWAMTTGHFKP